jgi:hypothetical protein
VVWAPALVGWVGGAGWNITFRDRSHRPGTGWYPLSPHDRYEPSWHASEEHLRWLNHHVRPDPHRGRDYRPQGLTVVPQDQFRPGGRVNVPRAPLATVAPAQVRNGAAAGIPMTSAPPAPAQLQHRGADAVRFDRNHDGRPDRIETSRFDRNHDGRPDRLETARAERDGFARQRPQPLTVQQQAPGLVPMPVPAQPQPVVSPTPHLPPAPQPVVSPTPHVSPAPQPLTSNSPVLQTPAAPPVTHGWQRQERQDRRDWDEARRERRDGDEAHRERRFAPAPAPVSTPPAAVQPAAVMMAPQPAPVQVARQAPPPQQQVSAQPRPAPAPAKAEERKFRGDEKRQSDR